MSKRRSSIDQVLSGSLLALLVVFIAGGYRVAAKQAIEIDPGVLEAVERDYGSAALVRIEAWQELVRTDESETDAEKLEKANNFFNDQIRFVDDIEHWGKEDYWATPVEFLSTQAGDCEDYAIAKYFTLKAMGVPESKLLITYVKALELNQAHMVLTYYEKPGAIPLVLDNLNPAILPATQRSDLLPVFSFNGGGLWTAKQRGKGKFIGDSGKVKLWKDLESRMGVGS